MKEITRFLTRISKFLIGFGLFLFCSAFILFLRLFFLALSAPCTACIDLSLWLNQTLGLLAPALASLTGGLFSKKRQKRGINF